MTITRRKPLTTLSLSLLLLFLITILSSATALGGGGGKVGGRTKITDVETNKEVQDLGRYSVQEYNRQQRNKGGSTGVGQLKFKKVVAAEKQVVSGIKYFLTVAAATSGGHVERFAAEVVVQPWKRTKELLHFAPHPPLTN